MRPARRGVRPIVVIDNYDSFVYNLVQYLGELAGDRVQVFRNDAVTVRALERLNPERIVISPGPCTPKEAGISNAVIRRFAGRVPILGVCLGHECIGTVFGARLDRARRLMHGKTSRIFHDAQTLFAGLPRPFNATRYHSLELRKASLPRDLELTAWTDDGEVMGIRHRRYRVEGVQFHPESILTTVGKRLLKNFLAQTGGSR